MPEFEYIGTVHSEFKTIENMPVQGAGISKGKGYLEIKNKYLYGIRDLEGFSHCYIVFHLHKIKSYSLSVKPFLDTVCRGIFATRSPKRPNAIGLSIVRIVSINGNKIYLDEIDILDGSPVFDIKPYIAQFDGVVSERDGWYEKGLDPLKALSDDRFA